MSTPYRKLRPRNRHPLGPILPFLLPLPLVLVIFKSLSQNALIPFLASSIALAMYFLSGYFLRRAKYYETKGRNRKWMRPTRVPWRFSAGVFTAIATFIVAWLAAGNSFFISLGYGLTAWVGMFFLYGKDPHFEDHSKGLVGVTADEIIDALDEAEAKIESIEDAAAKIEDPIIQGRFFHVADQTRGILKIIEEDPKDLRRARKFLKVYLDGARKVANNFAKGDHLQTDSTINSNIVEVLDTIESVIEEQREKLLRDDILELDVQIEVLQTQLKHEGIS